MKENFFYEGEFVRDLEDLLINLDVESVDELPDDWEIEVEDSDLEPMFQLSAKKLVETFGSDRDDEDGDAYEKAVDKLNKYIDFDKVNEMIPELYYCNGKTYKITKTDLL